MQLLADAVETYEESALARWWEWETASENRRQLTWSTGARDLRRLAGLAKDRTDEEIAREDIHAENRMHLAGHVWRKIVEHDWAPTLLTVAEQQSIDGARRWIAQKFGFWPRRRSARGAVLQP